MKTAHIQTRMSQRGITREMIDLVRRFGRHFGDRIVLSRKDIQKKLDELDEQRSGLLKIMDKGGMVVVEENGVLITAYRLTGLNRKKSKRRARYNGPPARETNDQMSPVIPGRDPETILRSEIPALSTVEG